MCNEPRRDSMDGHCVLFLCAFFYINTRCWVTHCSETIADVNTCVLFVSCPMSGGLILVRRYVGSVAHLKPSVAVQGGRLDYSEVPREGIASSVDYVAEMSTGRDKAADGGGGTPYLRLLSPHGPSGSRAVDNELTRRYLDALKSVCTYCPPPPPGTHTHTHTRTHFLLELCKEHVGTLLCVYGCGSSACHHQPHRVTFVQYAFSPLAMKSHTLARSRPRAHTHFFFLPSPITRVSSGSEGVSFANRNALVTGCGDGSIGIEIVAMLLEGGARVVVTTSGYSPDKIGM
jgi:3-oxoacyl-ACP reductase-like protein